jgi:hypothetical protein
MHGALRIFDSSANVLMREHRNKRERSGVSVLINKGTQVLCAVCVANGASFIKNKLKLEVWIQALLAIQLQVGGRAATLK